MNINATLLGQMVTFSVFVWFTMRFIWPALMEALDEREQTIRSGLQAAEQGERFLESAESEGQQTIQQAKEKASRIIKEAEDRAQGIEENAVSEATVKRDHIVSMAEKTIAQRKQVVMTELLDQMGAFIVAGASQVMGSEIKEKHHTELLAKLNDEMRDFVASDEVHT